MDFGVAILLSVKLDFKLKLVRRDRERYYILIKNISREDLVILNIYIKKPRACKFIKETKL